MSDPKPSLAKAIKGHFAPALRRDGFGGTGQRYWRVVGDQCQVVEVQGSRHGGEFAVNLGIQPLSVPFRWGEMNPKRLRQMECMFRRRLAIRDGDQWWRYSPNQQSMDAAARDAWTVYEQVGREQLQFMAQRNSPLNTVTPDAFVAGTFDFKGFANTGVLMALTLAQMRRAAGNGIDARGFASAALKEIGDGPVGSGLKLELRQLLESA